MVDAALPDRIDYAILSVVFRTPAEEFSGDWCDWEIEVRKLADDYQQPHDLLAAFKRLWNGGMIHLTRQDEHGHTIEYSGHDTDDERVFFGGTFAAFGTPAGCACWDGIEMRWGHLSNRKAASPFQ